MQTETFDALAISKELCRAVQDVGYEAMTPIQAKAIPLILQGKDIIGQAQTGTGKTLAFGLPLLNSIQPSNRKTQAIVLCPTRELAVQVADELKRVLIHMREIKVLPIYGGQPIAQQIHGLRAGAHVIIGTPGRTIDHINRGTLKLDKVKTVVLDEADRMLDMGFVDEVEKILRRIPAERQTLLFFGDHAQADPRPGPEISAGAGVCQSGPETVDRPSCRAVLPWSPRGHQAGCPVPPHRSAQPEVFPRFLQQEKERGRSGQEAWGKRVSCSRSPRRHDPAATGACHGQVQEEYLRDPRGHGRCGERHQCAGHSGGFQLRPSHGQRILRSPNRQDRARRKEGACFFLRVGERNRKAPGNRSLCRNKNCLNACPFH